MAGTVTETRSFGDGTRREESRVNRIALAWTCTSGGAVSGNASATISGTILKVQFIPGSGGDQPTNAYDVTLTDTAGIDVLAGQGADLSNSTPTSVIPGVPLKDGTTTSVGPCVVNDPLTLVVANAGSVKSGTVVLYVR